jgi:hypothetical protein
MAKGTGKGYWGYSGISGLTVGQTPQMKLLKKRISGGGKVTTPGFKTGNPPTGKPYQKDKSVNKLYKTY